MSPHKRQAVIYTRIASKAANDCGQANREQELLCRNFAAADYDVTAVFDDHASGTTTHRSGLDAMVAYLNTRRAYAPVVIVDAPYRLARGLHAFAEISAAIVAAGAEIKIVPTALT